MSKLFPDYGIRLHTGSAIGLIHVLYFVFSVIYTIFLRISDKLVDGQDCTVANDPTQCHAPSICVALVENGAEGKCTPGKHFQGSVYNCNSLPLCLLMF